LIWLEFSPPRHPPRWQVDADIDALRETLNRNQSRQRTRLAADQSETPVLMALFLACWRWLMPPAAGHGPSAHAWQPPPAAIPAAAWRQAFTLAPIHAPPLRLLT
jgi:hypothetical protein